MKKGERGRGEHEIEDEILFPSLAGFVFHDSRGLEAGSVTEVATIENFVKRRSEAVQNKDEQLHAIWVCLPLDNARPLMDAEEKLCRINSSGVPVVAIFTKRDARYSVDYNMARQSTTSREEAKAAAEKGVEKWIEDIRDRLKGDPSPSGYITAPDLQEYSYDGETFCKGLISKTQDLLPSSKMKALLVTVWRNNISERSLWVFRSLLVRYLRRFRTQTTTRKTIATIVLIFLPPDVNVDRIVSPPVNVASNEI
ncbi:hypothetical protein OF83DRAFT_1120442 [Amylostereum chailletii]|nr:hypothetical protein OF83DRAFT_1120442 [Amylostereum chailletii]